MVYSTNLLETHKIWKHLKRGTTYEIIGISECATNGDNEGQQVVVYKSIKDGKLWHRYIHQFLDGRFEPQPNKFYDECGLGTNLTGECTLPKKHYGPHSWEPTNSCNKTLTCLKDEGHDGECGR